MTVVREAATLERLFDACFRESHRTRLVGGADEPLYVPATADGCAEIRYRQDYFASALHEVAHWCIAGAARRALPDYGYWYAEAGRDAAAQRAFEAAEVGPQAIEALFSAACAWPFRISLDNPGRDDFDPQPFVRAVDAEAARLDDGALPPRAARFRAALRRHYCGTESGTESGTGAGTGARTEAGRDEGREAVAGAS